MDITAAGGDPASFEDAINRLAEDTYNGDRVDNDPELLHQTATDLMDRVRKEYGKKALSVAYNTPDFGMLRNLEQNVYHFSAAKNYQQLKELTLALTNGQELRTQSEFFKQVQQMNLKYNRDWLATERNTAIAGGQMASRWVEFEQNKEAMPMLQYSTVGDGKVRDSHRALDGIIKPVDDPFWNVHYPPNGWNCRCDVLQLPGRNTTPTQSEGDAMVIAPMFRTNLAKQGLVFPKEHPYFDGVPKPELRKAMAYLPPENSYRSVKGIGGTTIEVHLMHNSDEIMKNLLVADDLMAIGYKEVKLLPDLHEKEAALKVRFYPAAYRPKNIKKNPDAWIQTADGKDMVCDFKVMTGENNFAKHIQDASEQANYAVIKFLFTPHKRGISSIRETITRKFESTSNLKGVLVLDKEGALYYEQYR